MTKTESTSGRDPGVDESLSQPGPMVPGSRAGRRFLHLMLTLLLAAPLVVWALGSVPPAEVGAIPGGDAGEAAADFALGLFDGTTFTLSDHLSKDGRPVVMNFWASWCVPCRVEMPAIDAVARRRPDVVFLGVAVQDTEIAARAFADDIVVSYALGYDADGLILEKYPVLGLPTTWFITSDGIIARRWFGQLDERVLEELIDRHLSG